jgi:hypothetical protein
VLLSANFHFRRSTSTVAAPAMGFGSIKSVDTKMSTRELLSYLAEL